MRSSIVRLIILLLMLTVSVGVASYAQSGPLPFSSNSSVGYFYEALLPYGQWMWQQDEGWGWAPYNMPIDWRPYTDGHWEFTDDGWTWASDLPWGWACFHYGRWLYDDTYGWIWYPDTVWAPCWVAWRYNDDWIGWAPLPPRARWRHNHGLEFNDHDADDLIPQHAYSFAPYRHMDDVRLVDHIEPLHRNVTLIGSTTLIVKTIVNEKGRAVNRLPFENKIVAGAGHQIVRRKLVNTAAPEQHGVMGDEVRVFHPDALKKSATAVPARWERQVKPPEVSARHAQEVVNLKQIHAQREQQLNEIHAREAREISTGVTPEKLEQQ
ncbi:MAG: hypothetical protein HQL22_12915, partial [Candidatus Omnitrophica bacterium]|nr:hypothetical protein [Candidatus Omnitrophota bacterium]